VCATILTILASAMTSFVIVRNGKWKVCTAVFALMVASMVIPFQVLMVPLVSVYGGIFGILNSRLTLILMHTGFSVSMATFMFHGAIHSNIPLELEEAALIDGMGYFGIMRNVFIPLSVPALATITLYYAVYFWNDWFNALIYLKSEQYPVMMILRNLVNGTMQMDVGNASSERDTVSIALKSAVIITSSVPIVVLYPFLSKYFVKGLTIGGVKG
jgi:raffinose/stachyose/melibiose transport system permease protein